MPGGWELLEPELRPDGNLVINVRTNTGAIHRWWEAGSDLVGGSAIGAQTRRVLAPVLEGCYEVPDQVSDLFPTYVMSGRRESVEKECAAVCLGLPSCQYFAVHQPSTLFYWFLQCYVGLTADLETLPQSTCDNIPQLAEKWIQVYSVQEALKEDLEQDLSAIQLDPEYSACKPLGLPFRIFQVAHRGEPGRTVPWYHGCAFC